MNVEQEVLNALDEALSLRGRAQGFTRRTPLLGDLPELDSMAVVTVIATIEDHFGIVVHDDEIDGDTFANVGALVDFVLAKIG